MQGKTTLSSTCGTVSSLVLLNIMMIYAAIKLVRLVSHANPNITTFEEFDVFDSSEVLNYRDQGLRFAFAVEGYWDEELKNDPKYVRTMARLVGKRKGVYYEEILNFHLCTDADYAEFAPPSAEGATMLEAIKENPKRGLYCLDWQRDGDILESWGAENWDEY